MFHCSSCGFITEDGFVPWCKKLNHQLPNGYAMAAHSSKCGEVLTGEEKKTLVAMDLG
jgi:hypothetical protein